MITPSLRASLLAITVAISPFVLSSARAENEQNNAALAAAMKDAKTTLEAGLQTSEQKGRPISGKFEIDDSHLQLSVYTMQGNGLTEVVIHPATGAIAKAETITDSDDFAAATKQKKAAGDTSVSLFSATQQAVRANSGSRAVLVVPELTGDGPVAQVTLLQGDAFKRVSEKLNR
jgi:hypothetical protein